ncbi:MAG: Hint domain-containing protein [Pseudoruegeria sp.]
MKPKTVGRFDGRIPVRRLVDPPCGVIHGTIVLSMDGEIPVEFLSVGDRVISRDKGMVRVTEIQTGVASIRPVLISQSSLGHDRPQGDILVHPKQSILIRDWRAQALYGAAQAMIPAEQLIDGEFVRFAEDVRRYRFTAICCDEIETLYAGGLEIGSQTRVDVSAPQVA